MILNPAAGRGKAGTYQHAIESHLQAAGVSFELRVTSNPGDAEALARAAQPDRYRAVVAVGGDGTINEIVNGIMPLSLPLGIIPVGTGNDFTKMLDLRPDRVDEAVARILSGRSRAVDVGIAGARVFVNGLGVGFEAAVAEATRRPTRLKGFAVYVKALLTTVAHYRASQMIVQFNGQRVERRLLLVSVGNGRSQGGGFYLTPEARIDDGLFDVCLVDDLRWHEFVRHVPKVLWGGHTGLPQVTMARTAALTLDVPGGAPVHVDGEILGRAVTHLEMTIKPGALEVLA